MIMLLILSDDAVFYQQCWLKLERYALIFNGKLLGFDDDESVSIIDALGTKSNYTDLMNGL